MHVAQQLLAGTAVTHPWLGVTDAVDTSSAVAQQATTAIIIRISIASASKFAPSCLSIPDMILHRRQRSDDAPTCQRCAFMSSNFCMAEKLKIAILYDTWGEDEAEAPPEPRKRKSRKRTRRRREKHDREEIFEALE